MAKKSRQIKALLFADIKGYSKLNDDRLYEKLSDILKREILARILNNEVMLHQTSGDGVILFSNTASPLANAALRLRDEFRNYNWIASGFPHNLQMRIALHMDEITIEENSNNQIEDFTGIGVIKTARIEPVIPPDTVHCSQIFQTFLSSSNSANLKTVSRGTMILAKDYGEMSVYEVLWHYEEPSDVTSNSIVDQQYTIPMPSISEQLSDKQKSDFLYDALPIIRDFFEKATRELKSQDSRIETTIRTINDAKFICEIYVSGSIKSRCKIWVGNMMGKSEYIFFKSGDFQLNEDNSWSDQVSVVVENNHLRLKSIMGMLAFLKDFDVQSSYTPEKIGEYFWRRLIAPL